ncbi:MAG: rRNA maturation RNase YbeY [Bacteroidota bacterium]
MNHPISFFISGITFTLRGKTKLRKWISSSIRKEGFKLTSLNYIFCSDESLLEMNIRHLNHHTYTDIITFDLSSEKKTIDGEIYISIDRVKDNAAKFSIPFTQELHRVMIHGTLHLCGYKDKTPAAQKKMRKQEDFYLAKII